LLGGGPASSNGPAWRVKIGLFDFIWVKNGFD